MAAAGREEQRQVEVEWWSSIGFDDVERGGEDGMALDMEMVKVRERPGGA